MLISYTLGIKVPRKGTETYTCLSPVFILNLKLDLKVPRKGTETSLYIFLNAYLLYIRIESTPKGDENAVVCQGEKGDCSATLDLKVLRKETETSLYIFLNAYLLYIRFEHAPKGDGNILLFIEFSKCLIVLDLKVFCYGTET